MHPLKRLITYTSDLKPEIKKASIFSFLNKLFDLAPPILIGMAVDTVVSPEDTYLHRIGFETLAQQLYLIAFLTFVIWAAESLFEYLFKIGWRNLAQEVQHRLRVQAYRKVQDLEISYFEDKSSGNLISVLNDDVNQLERFLDHGANDIIQIGSTVILIGAIFFYISPLVATISFIPVPIILWGSFLFQKKIAPRYASVREEVGLLSSILANNLRGMASVKSYNAEKFEVDLLDKQSRSYQYENSLAITLSSAFSPLIRMAVLIGFLGSLIVGGFLVEDGSLKVGSFSVLVFMTQRLLWPLTRLGETSDLYQRAMSSTRRIFSLMDSQVKVLPGKKKIENLSGNIEFSDVVFSYEPQRPVIDNISFTLESGQTIGLVGATGSGKSTLVKLILRFYDLDNGSISLDGTNIKDLSFESLRSSFSYVGQDNYLFHGTVADNIAYGSFDTKREKIIEAAKQAEAHDFIESLPFAYDTIVGERGQKLSGGQKQRIAIARALLKDAPIFLFDEATSAVDNETEAAIQRSLKVVTQSKTTIIIAHRLSTIVHADKILVLDGGKIIESGTHDELIQKGGLYHSLWNVQTGS